MGKTESAVVKHILATFDETTLRTAVTLFGQYQNNERIDVEDTDLSNISVPAAAYGSAFRAVPLSEGVEKRGCKIGEVSIETDTLCFVQSSVAKAIFSLRIWSKKKNLFLAVPPFQNVPAKSRTAYRVLNKAPI